MIRDGGATHDSPCTTTRGYRRLQWSREIIDKTSYSYYLLPCGNVYLCIGTIYNAYNSSHLHRDAHCPFRNNNIYNYVLFGVSDLFMSLKTGTTTTDNIIT